MEGLSTILAPSSSFNDFQILCYNSSCLLSMGMPGTKEDSLCLLSLIPKIDGKLSFVSTKKRKNKSGTERLANLFRMTN